MAASDADLARNANIDEAPELEHILAELRALRRTVVDAWQARAVVLSRDEQRKLRDEIRKTCDLLGTLVARD
jgi:uncharacterized protein YukE